MSERITARLASGLVATLVVCSCSDSPTGTGGMAAANRFRLSVSGDGPPTFTAVLMVGPDHNVSYSTAPITVGAYEDSTLVNIKAEGTVTIHNSVSGASNTYDPGGTSREFCEWSVAVTGVRFFSGFCRTYNFTTQPFNPVWEVTDKMTGVAPITAYWRGGGDCCVWPYGSSRLANGSFTITVTPVRGTANLLVQQPTGLANRTVTFTARRDAGVPYMKLKVMQWRWVPDSGTGQTVACTHTNAVCQAIVRESGTMYADITLNGFPETVHGRASAACAPIGGDFAIIDDPIVRDSLKVMWDASNPNDPDIANRQEVGFWIFRNPSGDIALVRMVPIEVSPTRIVPRPPEQWELPPGFELDRDFAGSAHSHPVKPWTPLPAGGRTGSRGPSTYDWESAQVQSGWVYRVLPLFFVDHWRIWRIARKPDGSAKSEQDKPRVSGACVRI